MFNFNPRSREGSDTDGSAMFQTNKYFNPRSREGSDLICQAVFLYFFISIHAPARGATLKDHKVTFISIFQSTLPRGERPIYFIYKFHFKIFQSTLPRGERHADRHIPDF